MESVSTLQFQNLKFNVSLGWTPREREMPQPVQVDVRFDFAAPPKACISDELEDTIDYDAVYGVIGESVASRPFKLLEHMVFHLYERVVGVVQQASKKLPPLHLEVTVMKLAPPVDGVRSARFTYSGDLP